MENCRYNSAVYTSLEANQFLVTVVTNNHFEPGAYTNTTKIKPDFLGLVRNTTTGMTYGDIGYQTNSHDIQLFISMLEGYNGSTPSYEDITPSQCIRLYTTDLVSDRRNLFMITNRTSSATNNNTLLDTWWSEDGCVISPATWTCIYPQSFPNCKAGVCGIPLLVRITEESRDELVEISGCKSEKVAEKCKVQFSLGIMIAVICCNLVKACCMVMAVVRSREPTLVTLGDAIDSFLRSPDRTTMNICFADRQFIETEWARGSRARPRKWNQKGVQRWWSSLSKTRWITCNFFCLIAIITTVVFLEKGIGQDRAYLGTDIKSL